MIQPVEIIIYTLLKKFSVSKFRFKSSYTLKKVIDNRHTFYYHTTMKYFKWNSDKNEQLKRDRNISFEIITYLIESGKVLDIIENPNQDKYANQFIFIIEYNNYAFLVPFVEEENDILRIPVKLATYSG